MQKFGKAKDPKDHLGAWTPSRNVMPASRAERRQAAFNRRNAARRLAAARSRAALGVSK